MTGLRARGESIRKYILGNVGKHPADIAKRTALHFEVSRQAVNKHLKKLTDEKCLKESGNTRNRTYVPATLSEWKKLFYITPDLAEDVVWRNDIRATLGNLPANVMNIWHHGFTEMFNNAIDHSGSETIFVTIRKTGTATQMTIMDEGIGIFKKIQTAMNLLDERHAILELSKGKLTTDPKNHSGEGIFFTSRMFDSFDILSGGVFLSHEFGKAEDWILERPKSDNGTMVFLGLNNHTSRTAKRVFDLFSSGEEFGFTKTIVPVVLARYGNDSLISRSQAKRLLARVELFKTVIFDFTNVNSIGQAFADEIYRVFASQHPEMEILSKGGSTQVTQMIARAKAGLAAQEKI